MPKEGDACERTNERTNELILVAALGIAITGCTADVVTEAEADLSDGRVHASAHLHRGIPERLQTRIVVADDDDDDDSEFDEGTALPPGVDVGFVSSGGRALFPFVGAPRTFASLSDLVAFAQRTLGASVLVAGKTPQPSGFRYRSVSVGATYYADGSSQTLYRVTDPVAALLGDLDGRVTIGTDTVCMSQTPCSAGALASYLVPVDADPPGIDQCSSDAFLCTFDTSFFNKSWSPFPIPFQYARHGGNIFIHQAGVPHAPPPPLWVQIRICAASDPGASCFNAFRGFEVCICSNPEPTPPTPTPTPLLLAVEVQLQSGNGFLGDPTNDIVGLGVARASDVDHLELAAGGALFGVGSDEESTFVEYEADGVCSGHTTNRMTPAQNVANQTQNATLNLPSFCPAPPFPR